MFSKSTTGFFVSAVLLLTYSALCSAFQAATIVAQKRSCTEMFRMAESDDGNNAAAVAYELPPNVVSNNALAEDNGFPAIILSPFEPAADPNYMSNGPIGGNDFVVSREGEPTSEELANENLIQIVNRRSNVTDLEVNTLAWKCLGYRFEDGEWNARKVFPKWKERYPTPPDVIGMQRIYTKEIDGELIKNNQRLAVSVPLDRKQSLKTFLKPYGFTGYKVSELTPNLTRRAQVTNWLLYYREELFGFTMEELIAKRDKKKAIEEEEERKRIEEKREEKWKPPIREVY